MFLFDTEGSILEEQAKFDWEKLKGLNIGLPFLSGGIGSRMTIPSGFASSPVAKELFSLTSTAGLRLVRVQGYAEGKKFCNELNPGS